MTYRSSTFDTRISHRKSLQAFLPVTLEERIRKMTERLNQQWPTFGASGLGKDSYLLHIGDHESGTVVRFFEDDAKSFTSTAAVKHGAYWHLSEPVGAAVRLNNRQMQAWLADQNLNWVVTL